MWPCENQGLEDGTKSSNSVEKDRCESSSDITNEPMPTEANRSQSIERRTEIATESSLVEDVTARNFQEAKCSESVKKSEEWIVLDIPSQTQQKNQENNGHDDEFECICRHDVSDITGATYNPPERKYLLSGIDLSPDEEKKASVYRKMLKMMVPPEAVAHKMTRDGVGQKIVSAVLGEESSVAKKEDWSEHSWFTVPKPAAPHEQPKAPNANLQNRKLVIELVATRAQIRNLQHEINTLQHRPQPTKSKRPDSGGIALDQEYSNDLTAKGEEAHESSSSTETVFVQNKGFTDSYGLPGVYTGYVSSSDGQATGRGRAEFEDGTVYEGDFRLGRKHGSGTWTSPNGTKYEGNFSRDCFHGYGRMEKNDGRSYVGNWRDSKAHGRGTEFSFDGDISYDGEWYEGLPVGMPQQEGFSGNPHMNLHPMEENLDLD